MTLPPRVYICRRGCGRGRWLNHSPTASSIRGVQATRSALVTSNQEQSIVAALTPQRYRGVVVVAPSRVVAFDSAQVLQDERAKDIRGWCLAGNEEKRRARRPQALLRKPLSLSLMVIGV